MEKIRYAKHLTQNRYVKEVICYNEGAEYPYLVESSIALPGEFFQVDAEFTLNKEKYELALEKDYDKYLKDEEKAKEEVDKNIQDELKSIKATRALEFKKAGFTNEQIDLLLG